jgi:hypothetical protein
MAGVCLADARLVKRNDLSPQAGGAASASAPSPRNAAPVAGLTGGEKAPAATTPAP